MKNGTCIVNGKRCSVVFHPENARKAPKKPPVNPEMEKKLREAGFPVK